MELTKDELKFIYTLLLLNEDKMYGDKIKFETYAERSSHKNKNRLVESIEKSITTNKNIRNKIKKIIE